MSHVVKQALEAFRGRSERRPHRGVRDGEQRMDEGALAHRWPVLRPVRRGGLLGDNAAEDELELLGRKA